MREFTLRKDCFLALRDVGRSVIRCRSGVIWVTQPGDICDHFLQPEEEFLVTGAGVVIVEARRDAAVEVTT